MKIRHSITFGELSEEVQGLIKKLNIETKEGIIKVVEDDGQLSFPDKSDDNLGEIQRNEMINVLSEEIKVIIDQKIKAHLK